MPSIFGGGGSDAVIVEGAMTLNETATSKTVKRFILQTSMVALSCACPPRLSRQRLQLFCDTCIQNNFQHTQKTPAPKFRQKCPRIEQTNPKRSYLPEQTMSFRRD